MLYYFIIHYYNNYRAKHFNKYQFCLFDQLIKSVDSSEESEHYYFVFVSHIYLAMILNVVDM